MKEKPKMYDMSSAKQFSLMMIDIFRERLTLIPQPIRDSLSRALNRMLTIFLGTLELTPLSVQPSQIPPVKSVRASATFPPFRASYDPQSLQSQVTERIVRGKNSYPIHLRYRIYSYHKLHSYRIDTFNLGYNT